MSGLKSVSYTHLAVILRFGMKAFWAIWAIWMFVTLVPAKLIENEALAAKMHQFGMQIGFGNIVQYLVVVGVIACLLYTSGKGSRGT